MKGYTNSVKHVIVHASNTLMSDLQEDVIEARFDGKMKLFNFMHELLVLHQSIYQHVKSVIFS